MSCDFCDDLQVEKWRLEDDLVTAAERILELEQELEEARDDLRTLREEAEEERERHQADTCVLDAIEATLTDRWR